MRALKLPRPILPRQILPRWIDMLSPAILSAAALVFLLGFGQTPMRSYSSAARQPPAGASLSSPALSAYVHTTGSSEASLVPARAIPQSAGVMETVLICATPHATSPAARPFASGNQPILCTFKPL